MFSRPLEPAEPAPLNNKPDVVRLLSRGIRGDDDDMIMSPVPLPRDNVARELE